MESNILIIKCPIQWTEVPTEFKWITVDYDGEVYAHRQQPEFGGLFWNYLSNQHYSKFIVKVDPPEDASQCIWERQNS